LSQNFEPFDCAVEDTNVLDLKQPQYPQITHTIVAMALKRINKELTDLGRYVDPLLSPPPGLLVGRLHRRGSLQKIINNFTLGDQSVWKDT
jgi:hypothetical protein